MTINLSSEGSIHTLIDRLHGEAGLYFVHEIDGQLQLENVRDRVRPPNDQEKDWVIKRAKELGLA